MSRKLFFSLSVFIYLTVVKSIPVYVATTEKSSDKDVVTEDDSTPKITDFQITSNVSNRYAKTLVTSKVKNYASTAQETSFSVVLPNKAYISGFVLEMNEKSYVAYVKEKEEALQTYNQAVRQGLSAGHVSANARESNRFDVTVNLEPQSKAAFLLTYEELLQREKGYYELVINIHPGQLVKNIVVEVNINESVPLTFVKTPDIRTGNEITTSEERNVDPRANIIHIDDKSAKVTFQPNLERQKQIAANLGTKEEDGLAGQFVVQYDVERSSSGGEVIFDDGYFVHFFGRDRGLRPFPKQVIFVLDTSSSMGGRKIKQLKDAMKSILSDLKEFDSFNIVDFSSVITVHEIKEGEEYREFPPAFVASRTNIQFAKEVIKKLQPFGATNIFGGLKTALKLVALENGTDLTQRQPLIVFLTDGLPNVEVSDTEQIVSRITEMNTAQKRTPIYSLSFGDGANKDFLKKLSLKNEGFSRHIYEASDASLQLQDFYQQISSPLFTNITFNYSPSFNNITKSKFPIFFGGSELVVSGTLDSTDFTPPYVETYNGLQGYYNYTSSTVKSDSPLERLWAYLTVKQILEEKELAENKTGYDQMALNLALKYSFVTPVSSLVVIKPNKSDDVVEPIAADQKRFQQTFITPPSKGIVSRRPEVSRSFAFDALSLESNFYPRSTSRAYFHNIGHPRVASLAPRPTYGWFENTRSDSTASQPKYGWHVANIHATTASNRPIGWNLSAIRAPSNSSARLSPIEKLKSELPWLDNVLTGNDTITTTKGSYNLGLNKTLPLGKQCPITPENGTGMCALLHECPSVLKFITNVDQFHQFVCDIQEYSGICCPIGQFEAFQF